MDFFSQWCASMDKGCDRGSTGALKAIASVFEALSTLLQLYGTACAPMLRQYGREVLDFVLRRFPSAQVCMCGRVYLFIHSFTHDRAILPCHPILVIILCYWHLSFHGGISYTYGENLY